MAYLVELETIVFLKFVDFVDVRNSHKVYTQKKFCCLAVEKQRTSELKSRVHLTP
jgi:hypothetical protein